MIDIERRLNFKFNIPLIGGAPIRVRALLVLLPIWFEEIALAYPLGAERGAVCSYTVKKRLTIFRSPAGMSLNKLSLTGKSQTFLYGV